ncbi:MAG: ROK family protein, partial [Candidatus Ornithospirochaeta sp.]
MSEIKGNNLPRIKVTNQALIREAIYKFGPISRLDISKRLDLTFPTITTNISLMLEDGLLVEKSDESSFPIGRGRKTMLVDINPKSRLFMGVEMRRHASYAVIVDLKGNIISKKSLKSFNDDYEGSLSAACNLAFSLLEESGMNWSDITGLGFCLPGIVDSKKGVLEVHPRFKWKNRDTREDVRKATGYNGLITIVNNTCARVYGSSLFNSSVFKGADHAAYMYVGTGIKCPLVFSLRNHFGSIVGEGEVGHMVVNPSGPECECGNHGCLESYASENA